VAKVRNEKDRPRKTRPIFVKFDRLYKRFPANWTPVRLNKTRQNEQAERLLAILLDSGGAQSGKAMLIDRELPGKEFVDGQRVAAAGFLERKQAAADRGNDFGLTANDPPFGPGRGQVGDC
jgi:hypothetical protein